MKFGVNGYAKFFLKDAEYEKFLEEQRKYAKEIGKIMDRQAEKSAKLYGISIEYMKHQNIL